MLADALRCFKDAIEMLLNSCQLSLTSKNFKQEWEKGGIVGMGK
jgi:hypothetical protein